MMQKWNPPVELTATTAPEGRPATVPSKDEVIVRLARLVEQEHNRAQPKWSCGARASTDPPQDCDWPVCGCDPYANKVIAALEESGLLCRPAESAATEETRDAVQNS